MVLSVNEKLRLQPFGFSTADIRQSINIPGLELPSSVRDCILSFTNVGKQVEKRKEYKDDWRICSNCGMYHIEPHTCFNLRRTHVDTPQGNG